MSLQKTDWSTIGCQCRGLALSRDGCGVPRGAYQRSTKASARLGRGIDWRGYRLSSTVICFTLSRYGRMASSTSRHCTQTILNSQKYMSGTECRVGLCPLCLCTACRKNVDNGLKETECSPSEITIFKKF